MKSSIPHVFTNSPNKRIAELIGELEHTREQKNLLWFEFSIATQKLAASQEEIDRLEKIVLSAQDAAIENGAALKSTQEQLAKAEQRVAEWQPISTAPKDGTRVLLCIDHGEWGDKVWTGLWGDGWMVSYGKARTEPTNWMPLPKAPNDASS